MIDFKQLDPKGVSLQGDGLAESVHVFDEDDVLAINAALATRRPLLVRGEPGTGKSQLARAAASVLGREFVQFTVNASTDTRDLLYQVDAVARLAEAQLIGARGHASEAEYRELLALERFTSPGPVWWALDPASARDQHHHSHSPYCGVLDPERAVERGVVVLIDEVDKADEAIPNGLLDALGDRRFLVPGRAEPVRLRSSVRSPLVVITTNEERALPNAFLRRCWVRVLELPADEEALLAFVVRRGAAHFPHARPELLERAARLLIRDRRAVRGHPVSPPGLAEYVDLVRAVLEQRSGDPAAQEELLERIAKFALRKHPEWQHGDVREPGEP